MVRKGIRSPGASTSSFQWKEPLGLVLSCAGILVALCVVLLGAIGAPAVQGGAGIPILVLLGGLALTAAGIYLVHLSRWRPGWQYDADTFEKAFEGLDATALRDIARALAQADEGEFHGVLQRGASGRFSRVLESVPGLCHRCARAARTQRFVLVRALVVPVVMMTVYVWEYLPARLCRECAGHGMRHFLGTGEDGGGAAALAGILWLPWNLPQYLWSRRLPAPPVDSGIPASTVRELAARAPSMVGRLRNGEGLRDIVQQAATEIDVTPGNIALFLIAYAEICRRQSHRSER